MAIADLLSRAAHDPMLDARDLVSLLQRRAQMQANDVACVFLDRGETELARLTFAALDRRARAIAARLQKLNLAGGPARALLLYPSGLDYIEAFFGCLYAGVVAVPAYPPTGRHRRRLEAIVEDAAPRIVLTVSHLAERFEGENLRAIHGDRLPWLATDDIVSDEAHDWTPQSVDGADLAFFQYTSGSTGAPRGVMLSHANLISNQALIKKSFEHTKGCDLVGWLPLYHDMGLIGNILQPLYIGATSYLMSPLSFLEKPVRWLRAISRYGAHTSGGPNFAYELCVRSATAEDKRDIDLSAWRIAFSGAEPVRASTLERFSAAFAECGFRRESFVPCYGLAEATLVVTAPRRRQAPPIYHADKAALEQGRAVAAASDLGRAFVGCGAAWPEFDVAIVDPESRATLPERCVGEIWVAGPSVGAGYWNKPEDATRTFGARRLDDDHGRFLRTGDLGFLDQGELFVTGRLKDLIIIAGRNYYPEDFERVLDERVPALRAGCSAVFSVSHDDAEELILVAEPLRSELHRLREDGWAALFQNIRASLSEDCDAAPNIIILVPHGSVPKTSSGKIRRSACRELYMRNEFQMLARSDARQPGGGTIDSGATIDPRIDPQANALRQALELLTSKQRRNVIVGILISNAANILRTAPANIADDMAISRAGLDSLRILELKHRVEATLGIELPLTLLFSDLTFSAIAETLSLAQSAAGSDEAKPASAFEEGALSCAQRSIFAIHELESRLSYNLHLALNIEGRVDARLLNATFDRLLERHELLRTAYRGGDSGISQSTKTVAEVGAYFACVDAQDWSAQQVQEDMCVRTFEPFDLESGAVLRATLYRQAPDRATLLCVAHHIALDLWSLQILLTELGEIYRAKAAGGQDNFAPGDSRYAAHVVSQRQYLQSARYEDDWAYWHRRLAGDLPILALGADRLQRGAASYRGDSCLLQLDRATASKLKSVAAEHGATLFCVLLAAYKILLWRHSGQRDVIVGTAASGRGDRRFANVVGNFVNPLALRTAISPEATFADYLDDVRRCVNEALAHQDFPFAVLVERLQSDRVPGQWPIFQTWFALQQALDDNAGELAQLALGENTQAFALGPWRVAGLSLEERVERFDLKLMAAETDNGIALSFQYRRDLFAPEWIAGLARRFGVLLEAIVELPSTCVSDLPTSGHDEVRHILAAANGAVRCYGAKDDVLALFSERAAQSPDSLALIGGDGALTFKQVEATANRLANFLVARGLRQGDAIGLCARRSVETVVAILAILKIGGAYLPIDAESPALRIAHMLDDANAKAVLGRSGWLGHIGDVGVDSIALDRDASTISSSSDQCPRTRARPSDTAYIIFTSGTTGRPKGVAISRESLCNYAAAILARLPESGLSFCLVSTLAADLGATVLFASLCSGGALHVPGDDEAMDSHAFCGYLARNRIDVLKITPSHFAVLARQGAEADAAPGKLLIFGGELLPWELVERIRRQAPDLQILNHYGPTEATVGALTYAVAQEKTATRHASALPVGRPLENVSVFVLTPDMALAPTGVAGEIFLGGAGLAQGYMGRPELTAGSFVPNPFGPPGTRLYRTGDLGSMDESGVIACLGRVDHQLKLRGYRIEPGEIEAQLREHPRVSQACVALHTEANGNVRLVAYVVGDGGNAPTPAELGTFLASALPKNMIPTAFIALAEMPLTQNGKIDRTRLPSPSLANAASVYRAPHSALELRLAAIFCALLGIERIGLDDNFFALGGDSILSIQAAARARNDGLSISAREIFEHQTLGELAASLGGAELQAPNGDPARALAQVGGTLLEEVYPLTPLQEGLLFHTLSRPNSGVYVMQHRYWIEGEVDVELFKAAWQAIVDAHAIFRTCFVWGDASRPRQRVQRRVDLPFDYLDIKDQSRDAQEICLDAILGDERRAGFDLSIAPALRIRLIRLDSARYLLIRSHHHILFDAWCTSLILKELQENYRLLQEKQKIARYARSDFGCYVEWLQRQDARAAERFWRAELEGFVEPTPVVGLLPAAAGSDEDAEDLVLYLSESGTIKLKELAQLYCVTLNTFAQAALALLLAHYTSRREVLFGVTVSGRPAELPGVERILGLFINGLPLRVAVDPQETLPAFSRKILAKNYAIRDFEHASLTDVQSWSDIPRGVDLFQYLLTFENAPVDPSLLEVGGDWRFVDCWHRTHTNYPLTFVVIPGDKLHLQLTFLKARIDRGTAVRLLGHYRRLLEEFARRPEARLEEFGLFDDDERGLILHEWNATDREYAAPRDIVGRFEAQARLTPEREAASCAGTAINYRALNERVNRLAHVLVEEGVAPDRFIGLFAERGLDFLVAMLAIFKAGGAYLPLEPAYPDGRIGQVLAESRVDLLLVGPTLLARARLAATTPGLTLLDYAALAAQGENSSNPVSRHSPQNAAFVIFTSGSTGAPKGAVVEHQGMFNNLITKVPALDLTARDVIAQTASQCFDISVWQHLTALTIGARVEIFPDAISRDPQRLLEEISARGVTILEAVPSMIRALLEAGGSGDTLRGLRWLLPCGEAFAPELCRAFMERHPHVRLLNAYGPAECSDDVSYHSIDARPRGNELSVPIGRPVDNTRLYIRNHWGDPAPIGAIGEICVAGVQVGRGYLNRPDLTAAVFTPDRFGAPGTRLYRTGDLGRYRTDGVIEFLGRVDHQVKIRGFRVEPGEIEACLLTHPRIDQACVTPREASKGVYRLVAHLVGGPIEIREMREHILRALPDFMVPSAFAFVESLPLTANGKIDRKRLPTTAIDDQLQPRHVAPRSDAELVLSEIWAEVLQTQHVGVQDNFFELGGHSLLAIQLRSRIRSAFDVEPPLRALFDHPTIEELAVVIEQLVIADLDALSDAAAEAMRDRLSAMGLSGEDAQ